MSTTIGIGRDRIDGSPVVFGTPGSGSHSVASVQAKAEMSGGSATTTPERLLAVNVRAVITIDHALTGSVSGSDSDDVSLTTGDRVLCIAQADGEENRIYVYNSAGAWVIANVDYAPALLVGVAAGGTTYGSTIAFLDESGPIDESTDLTWSFIRKMPTGTTDNSTFRWEVSTGEWTENVNFLADENGNLTINGNIVSLPNIPPGVGGNDVVVKTLGNLGTRTFPDLLSNNNGLTGPGTNNFLLRSTGSLTTTASMVKDDGTRLQVNTSATTGLLNIARDTASAAVIFARNTETSGSGVGILGQADNDTGTGVEGYATGATGTGVYGHTSGGYGVWGTASSSGTGVYAENESDGYALQAYANSSSATIPVAVVDQHHSSNTSRIGLFVHQAGIGDGIQIDSVGIGINALSTGNLQAGRFYRTVSGATTPVVEVLQASTANAQSGLKVVQSYTAAAALTQAIEAIATGTNTVGISSQSTGGRAYLAVESDGFFYGYRNANSYTKSGIELLMDHTGDAQDGFHIRHDGSGALYWGNMVGTGDLLHLQNNGTSAFRIPNLGRSLFTIGESRPFHVLTTSPTLDYSHWHARFSSGGGALTPTLPTAPPDGTLYLISRTGANNVTIGRGGSDTINGGTTQAIGNGALWFFHYRSATTDWFAIQLA